MRSFLNASFLALTTIAVVLAFHDKSAGQSNPSPYIPSVVPPSPNAATLMKFSDVPVSTYTGSADVTIPIYTVQAKGVAIPISLSYHTGGIRLKEEAGWVGLGWALSAGGTISRSIMDKDDFNGTIYYNTVVPETKGNMLGHSSPVGNLGIYGYNFFCNYLAYTDQGNKDFTNAFVNQSPAYDFEPDIYSYSFLGRSGKFIISRDKKVIFQKQDNIRVQFDDLGVKFTITDDEGNRFIFNDKETVQNNNGLPTSGSTSSWYLSTIISQENDTVKFNYYSDNTWTSIDGDISQSYRVACAGNEGLTSSQAPATLYWNITLQSIDFSNGQVQFTFDNSRVDLQNGKKLNNIKIYSKSPAGLKYVKEEQLFYSYFNGSYVGTDKEFKRLRLDSVREASGTAVLKPYSFAYFDPPSLVQLSGKHSYSADHWGYFNGVGNSTFVPTFRGVYNAPGDNPNLGHYLLIPGANREPDSLYAKSFALYQINYPTGGKTMFQFEPNIYDETKSANGPQDFPEVNVIDTSVTIVVNAHGTFTGSVNLSGIFPIVTTTPNATLTVTFRATTNNGCSVYRNTTGKIYFDIFGVHTDINNSGLTCDPLTPVCTKSTPINISSATSYPWTGYIDNTIGADFVEIRVTVSWEELRSVHYTNSTIVCSGLRVKSVTDYAVSGTIAKKRTYDYSYLQDRNGDGTPEKYSYGRLMSYPSYARYEPMIINTPNPQNCNSLTIFSSSSTSLNSVIQGNIVGYDQVTEYAVDSATGLDNGKTVYSYLNSPDTLYSYGGFRLPGVLNMGNNLNGTLISKVDYANAGTYYRKIAATLYNYHTTNRLCYYSMKYSYLAPLGSPGGYSAFCGGFTVPIQFLASFYPSIKSERMLLDSVTDITYDQLDTTKMLKTVKKSFYDNTLHYQLTRSSVVDSKGNRHISMVKYPQDYIPNGFTVTNNTILDSMISRNMLSSTIEKRDSFYYSGSQTGYINGASETRYKILTANSIGADKQYKLDVQSPVTDFQPFAISGNSISQDSRYRQMIVFDSYTPSNDIAQYTYVDQNPVSFLWDYKGNYPIAQVKNAAISNVAYTSFEAEGTGNWVISDTTRSLEGITGNKSFVLTSANNIAYINSSSNVDYIISYWSRDGQITVGGVTSLSSKTGLTRNGWTYYEQTIRTTGANIMLTAASVRTIDELRLYPITAKMITYTYEPLVGITSQCGIDNMITYYNYDTFTRLRSIRDADGNIIKTFEYNYKQ